MAHEYAPPKAVPRATSYDLDVAPKPARDNLLDPDFSVDGVRDAEGKLASDVRPLRSLTAITETPVRSTPTAREDE